MTIVPFSISGPLTVTMRALRIANTPRGGNTPCCVVGLPICWAMTAWPQIKQIEVNRVNAAIFCNKVMAGPPRSYRRASAGDGAEFPATVRVPAACSVLLVPASHALSRDRRDARYPAGDRNRPRRQQTSYQRANKH